MQSRQYLLSLLFLLLAMTASALAQPDSSVPAATVQDVPSQIELYVTVYYLLMGPFLGFAALFLSFVAALAGMRWNHYTSIYVMRPRLLLGLAAAPLVAIAFWNPQIAFNFLYVPALTILVFGFAVCCKRLWAWSAPPASDAKRSAEMLPDRASHCLPNPDCATDAS